MVADFQVARAGRFGTKGLAISFVSDEVDAKTLNSVQDRFDISITELPETIDVSTYSELNSTASSQPFKTPYILLFQSKEERIDVAAMQRRSDVSEWWCNRVCNWHCLPNCSSCGLIVFSCLYYC